MFNGGGNQKHRMVPEQLQHTNKMTHAAANSMALLEAAAKLRKAFRQLPAAVNVRVIQCSRPPRESRQIVPWIKDFRSVHVTANMPRNQFVILNHLHMIDESPNRHGLECHLSRHAVTDVVKPHHLVLIDRRRLSHTGFE